MNTKFECDGAKTIFFSVQGQKSPLNGVLHLIFPIKKAHQQRARAHAAVCELEAEEGWRAEDGAPQPPSRAHGPGRGWRRLDGARGTWRSGRHVHARRARRRAWPPRASATAVPVLAPLPDHRERREQGPFTPLLWLHVQSFTPLSLGHPRLLGLRVASPAPVRAARSGARSSHGKGGRVARCRKGRQGRR